MLKQSKGFALVELLVVIGIIAVLISILLPALGRVRHQAAVTACSARIRDVTMAVIMYANDNKGALPPRRGDAGDAGESWTLAAGDGPGFVYSAYTIGASRSVMGNGYGLGRLYTTGYIKTLKTLQCSSAMDPKTFTETWTESYNLYVLNPHLAYTKGGTFLTHWWKKLPNYGKSQGGKMMAKKNMGDTPVEREMPRYRRAILVEPIYGTSGTDARYNNHALGNRRAFNLAYPDGSVLSYTAQKYTYRTVDRWNNYLDLSGALQYATDGGAINWQGAWTSEYMWIPVLP